MCVTEGGRGSQTGSFQETKAMRWCGRWKAEGAKRRCHFATDSSCVSERDRGEKEICLLQISPRQQRPVSTDRQHCVLVAGVIVIYSLF